MNRTHGHKVRAARVETAIGYAWQASCSCGWEGRRYWTNGAAMVARGERWSHEIDAEDGVIPARATTPAR